MRCPDAGDHPLAGLVWFLTVLVGGGPLGPPRADEALTLTYGMTETCGYCVHDVRPPDGVELDVPGCRIRLRGPMLASGHLDPSPEDAARFTSDGWFITDDVGRVTNDAEGANFEVLGRADAVINTGGVKVDPLSVETLLHGLPPVSDAVVVGSPDADVPPTLDTLREAVPAALAPSHAPREVRVVDAIARDGMGKVSAAEQERLRSAR